MKNSLIPILTGSALMLSGALIAVVGMHPRQANAGMVSSNNGIISLTAAIQSNEDGQFVLDNASGTLAVYRTTVSPKKVEALATYDVKTAFGAGK
jgi:hypothetical protein